MVPVDDSILEAFDVARNEANEGERNRRITHATTSALSASGALTLALPVAYGGQCADAVQMFDTILALAVADGAAGWCAAIGSTTSSMAAFLAPEPAATIYQSPRVATAGVFAPNGDGVGTVVDGVAGFRVTGRWQWGSGSQHSEWIVGGARCDDDTQRVCFFRRAEIQFVDTWFTVGLRGTGSVDFTVDDVFVPEAFTIIPGVSSPQVDEPLANFPNFTLLAFSVAACGLGIARHALDLLRELATEKTPQFSARTLAASGFTQTEFARAEARWRAAYAGLRNEIVAAWAEAQAGRGVSVDTRVAMRLAAVYAASESAAVTDAAFTLAGGTAVYDSSPLGRCLRDAHVVTQHIMVAPKLAETLGKQLLGGEIDARMI